MNTGEGKGAEVFYLYKFTIAIYTWVRYAHKKPIANHLTLLSKKSISINGL